MNLESLYTQFPWPLQNAFASLQGWCIKKQRYNAEFRKRLKEYEARTFWKEADIVAFRDKRLKHFLTHCFNTVPYYQRLAEELNLKAEDFQGLDDLKKLPILTKKMVQDSPQDFFSTAVSKTDCFKAHTSGSTGTGLEFWVAKAANHEMWATWWRYRRWHGINLDAWCAHFGGRSVVPLTQERPPFWRYNLPGRQILYSGYHLNPENMESYITHLRKKQPPWLHGYPSILALLAAYLCEKGESIGFPVQHVTTGAENLMPNQAAVIERAFGVKPKEHYGMAEGVANISECPEGKLHVDEDYAAVEFVPNDDNETYKIIGSNFTNPATPMIRYDVGDVAEMSEEKCSCGRPGRIVKQIDGRREDYIVLKDNTKIGRMYHVFAEMTNVREAQIYQREPGKIIVRIVRNAAYTEEDEKKLYCELIKRVGEDTEIEIVHVNELQRTRTGKLRFVVSEV